MRTETVGFSEVAKFSTTMSQIGNNTGIEVPAAVLSARDGGKRPAVVAKLEG